MLTLEVLGRLEELAEEFRGLQSGYAGDEQREGSNSGQLNALIAGSDSEAKAEALEFLADELRLDVHRVDLSRVVSKWIGETEKNLAQGFDAAERSGAILLFDEADALFGKRIPSEDPEAPEADDQVSVVPSLGRRQGLSIFSVRSADDMNPPEKRRIQFVVNFPSSDQV